MESVSFATAPRSRFSENLPAIRETLARTRSYAATARQTGVPELTIRALLAPPAARPGYSPPVPEVNTTPLTVREIIALCCAEEGVSYGDIISENRKRRYAWPRQRMMWLIRMAKPNVSLPEIGRRFGGRDHTTVIHALEVVPDRCVTHPDERAKLSALVDALEEVASPRAAAASIDDEIALLRARIAELEDKRRAVSFSAMKAAA